MAYLIDVNVGIALLDSECEHCSVAWNWFHRQAHSGWATCPLIENGILRILGWHNYPNGPGSADNVRPMLAKLMNEPGYQFWPDDLSLMDRSAMPLLPGSKHLTDIYLLALAVKHGGKFVTLDYRIKPSVVPQGEDALLVLPKPIV